MKRLIFLKTEYGEKADRALKQFRADLKALDFIKIVKEYAPKAEVLVEFPDGKSQEAYDELRKLDIVEVIDSILPKE